MSGLNIPPPPPPPVDFFGVTSRDLFCVCCIGEELITGTTGVVVIVDEEEEEDDDGIGVFTRLSLVDDTGVCIIVAGSSVSRAEDEDLAGGRDGVFKPDEDGSELVEMEEPTPALLELRRGSSIEDRPVIDPSPPPPPPSPCFRYT